MEFNNICSLCGNCSSVEGIECPYNRIISQRKGVCLCLKQSRICGSCGICQSCAANHWKNHCESDPNRLIICNANYVNVPTRPISQFMGSKFTVDIYQENSNTFAGLLINDTDIMVDIFGITNSCKNGAAIFADNLNNIPSPLPISVLSFEISESYFYKSDLYQFSKCSGINVLQELGILTYNNETEVSLVVGKFPVSPDRRRFSMEILNPGASGRITIGLVPANYSVIQPGWGENSLAYHGDDGGIFLGESVPQIIRETFSEVNNCIEVIIEYESSLDSPELVRHITWRKNGKFVEKILIQHDKELYPAIGMHSINEQVRLLDFEVWADTECSSNVENNIKIENTVTVSPESIIYLEANEGFSGIFYVIPKTDLMKSLEFKIFHKYDGTETVGWMLESHNKLLNSNKTQGKWLFDIFSNSNIEFFTFGLKTSITTNIHDWMLKLTVLTTTDKSKTFQWQLSSCDWLVMSNENVFSIKEVPDQHTVAAKPSLLLTTTLNSSVDLEKPDLRKTNTSGQIRYYHIPIADYKLFFRADKQNAWIRCSNYMKPNFTRSFQIGNLIALDKIPALILQVNKSKEQLKLSGKDELINFNDSRLKPIMQTGKPLLSLKLSKNRKYNQFSITNKGLLSVPTPSRPWLFAFNWENDNTFPIDELYFSTDCSEYHGMNICLLNSISTVEEEVPPNDKLDNIVTLPFNQNEKEMENFLWEHSMLHLISWDKLLFYPFCPGKSTIYDSKPHLVNTEGIELFEVNSSPSEICKAVFFNPKLLLCHKLILNYKFLLPKYNRILRKEITDFSQDEIEYLIFSILNKITSYMVLTNLFFDEKYAFTQSLKVNWNKYFENYNNHSLVLESHGVSCKLHSSLYDEQINLDDIIGAPETNQKDNEIIMENHSVFDYAKCSQSIILSGKTVKELPAELFVKFINLCSLELRNMFQLKCLPRTIYSLKGLQRLIINQVKINTLPDIYEFPNLKYLQIEKCPIKTYNDSNECLKLETLKLLALPLQTISNFICLQENLVVVELQLHGIESLPDEFGRLENMKELKLIGSPLYYELLKNDFIIKSDNLEFEYPEIGFYKVKENDKNPISFLPVADIFINVPRIGSGYSEPVDVNSHGGFPMAILQLKKLTTLVIQHQSIRYVPDSIQQLENLEILDLSYNPLLEKVSAQISSITSIKQLILVHCPSISVPPPEIIARGTSLSYLKYLLAKTVVCNRTKLMFVGLGEAGKTSLLHALRSDENSAKEIIEQQEKQVTDGIDITKWTVICHNEEIQYSAWDFAGQDVYYNTHQFFLSEKAIYIVVWSVRQGIEHGDLDFWLSSISCHSKYAPVFVVGTRCDQVQADMSCFSSLKKRYSQIEDFILVDSLSGTGIKDLKQKLIHVTLNLPYMHQAIPSTILDLENQFTSIRSQKNYITYQEFQNIAISQGIFEKDVKSVIQILHDFGSIQYFDTEILKNYVVINPQWIVDIMANVVSVVNQKIKNGIFYHENMKDVWDKFESKLFNWMLNLTEEFDLTFPHPTMEPKANIVPCLLSEEEPEIEWPKFSEQTLCKYYHINYKFEFLPAGLFNRIQVRLFDFTEAKKLWKYGMYFEKNGHHVLFMRENKNSLIVRAIGVRPVNVLAMVDDVIKGLVKASFHGVRYNLEISCPDCIEYGNNISNDATKYWSNISMIPSKLIKKALIKKVEYLQCEELHLNSIKSIKENTPETASAEEFINDLISKVQTVKSLYASSDKLVTFLHSTKDLTDLSAMPMKEFDNLFSDCNIVCIKINETSEVKWKTSISNCQLCLICLSENFIQIPKMNEMLEYIKLLKKKFILLILSSDKEIRQKWEYYPYFMTVFIKINATHPKASTEKILEIKKAIQDSIVSSTVNETAGETYDCFVSYCWANSQDAVNKGTKAIPGAIISPDADPRKLARYLIDNGIKCWIDDSHMDKTSGLNSQLSLNLRNSKMMLAFVSDEYDKSDNCKMELNFMVEELRRPVSYVLVGSNMEWRFNSEVGLIMQKRHRSEILNFTNNNNISESRLLEELKVRLRNCPDIAYEKNDQNKIQGHNTALMEQLELISRQILNQLISFITDNCPRLIVIDVDPDDGTDSQIDNDIIMDSTLQSSLRASVSGNKLALKVICEGETNWHIADEAYLLSIEDKDEIIEKCAVYLYMIYQVFEYKNPGLRCLQPDNISNMEFITKITQIAGSSTMTFKESYSNMVKYYMKYDPKLANCSLERYRLPSGREFWMCKKHADQNPRCKLIERDRAAIDTFAIPIDNYDTSLLGDIKSKISSDTLQHNDSFHSIVQRFKTTDPASNRTTKHDLTLPKKKLFFRSDTILNLEKDIVTNKKDTYDIPIRISSEVNARNVYNQIPSKPVNRRLSAMNRPNLVGSRICTIQ